MNNEDLPLKQWVRNKVVVTLRYTNKIQWYYVKSEDMSADLGTWKGASIEDVSENSTWKKGFPWMEKIFLSKPMQK